MSDRDQNQLGEMELEAFRFLSGEMTADEQSHFEDRLASEPQLAIALSKVIELDRAVEQACATGLASALKLTVQRAPQHTASKQPAALAVVAAIAACIMAAVLVAPRNSPTTNDLVAANGPVETETAPEFVDQWLDSITQDTTEFADLSEPGSEPIELAMLDIDGEEEVPDWMFVAFETDNSDGVIE